MEAVRKAPVCTLRISLAHIVGAVALSKSAERKILDTLEKFETIRDRLAAVTADPACSQTTRYEVVVELARAVDALHEAWDDLLVALPDEAMMRGLHVAVEQHSHREGNEAEKEPGKVREITN